MVPTQTVQEVMTPDPVTVSANAPLRNVARKMRDSDIGNVVVMEDGYICGIVRVDLMREKAIRRLPVVADGRPVGIVSIGDPRVAQGGTG